MIVLQLERAKPIGAALGAALLYGLALYAGTRWLHAESGMAVVAFLVGAPIGCCILASVIIDPRGQRSGAAHAAYGALTITLVLIMGWLVLREGSVCLIMAAPIFYMAGISASIFTLFFLQRKRGPPAATLAIIPLIGLPLERMAEYPADTGQVKSSIVINAPPEVIWRNTVELRDIRPKELPLDFSHTVLGIPQPVDAQLQGVGPGAVRKIQWTRTMHFDEVVTEWRPTKHLGWTFRFAKDSIPLAVERNINLNGEYLRLTGGSYDLRPLPGGRTELVLQTRYWVKTPVNAYCHGWASIFLNDIHGAVLRVIKARSEEQARGRQAMLARGPARG